jgi:hypothetical protein
MSAEQVRAPQPLCEQCWISQNAEWEPHSMDNEGNILMRLKDVEVPTKYNLGAVEICSECGKITIAGIYDLPPKRRFDFGAENLKQTEQEDDERP